MNTLDRYHRMLDLTSKAVTARRLELGLSQAALAGTAGVDAKTLRSLERGDRWPQDISRAKIERALEWPDGTLEALLVGDMEWTEIGNPDGTWEPGLVDLRAPVEDISPEEQDRLNEEALARYEAERPAADLDASELAALLVTRSQHLERRVRELEQELEDVRGARRRRDKRASGKRVPMSQEEFLRHRRTPLVPDDEDLGQWAENEELATKADFGRAAMAGHSELEKDDATANQRGEGSQDPGDLSPNEGSA